MDQTVFNWVLSALGALLGFLLRTVWQAVKDLQDADKELAEKVSTIETLVAGQYVTRTEHQATIAALFSKLDRIEDKIDNKADKCPVK